MQYIVYPLLLILLVSGFASVDTAMPPQDKAKIVFEDDFGRKIIGDQYQHKYNNPNEVFPIIDGVLVCHQLNPEHGSVLRRNMDFKDIDVVFDFRFSGGTSFNFVMDDQNEKSVWASHISRVSVFRNSVILQDDKTGFFNLDIRAQRQNKNLPPEDKKALDELLASKRKTAKMNFVEGQWYQLRVLLKGDTLEVWIDGMSIAKLQSPGLAHPTKTKFGWTVNGSHIDFDNLKVFQMP